MPYFPKVEERSYTCPGCGGRFFPLGFSCCVLHPPGTCCHYGERREGDKYPTRVWIAVTPPFGSDGVTPVLPFKPGKKGM